MVETRSHFSSETPDIPPGSVGLTLTAVLQGRLPQRWNLRPAPPGHSPTPGLRLAEQAPPSPRPFPLGSPPECSDCFSTAWRRIPGDTHTRGPRRSWILRRAAWISAPLWLGRRCRYCSPCCCSSSWTEPVSSRAPTRSRAPCSPGGPSPPPRSLLPGPEP